MGNDKTTNMNQYSIELLNIFSSIFHLQDNYKKYAISVVEMDKCVYIFYTGQNQFNMDYLEAFKAHLKVIKAHNGSMWFHLGLAQARLPEKQTPPGVMQVENRILIPS